MQSFNDDYLVARHVSKLIHCQVLVQMGAHDNRIAISGRLQNPHLFLFQSFTIGVDFEAESLGAQVLELGVDEADGPTASLGSRSAVGSVGHIGARHGCNFMILDISFVDQSQAFILLLAFGMINTISRLIFFPCFLSGCPTAQSVHVCHIFGGGFLSLCQFGNKQKKRLLQLSVFSLSSCVTSMWNNVGLMLYAELE